MDIEKLKSEGAARSSQPATPLNGMIVGENMRREAQEQIDAAYAAGKRPSDELYRQQSQGYAIEDEALRHFGRGGSDFDFSKKS